VRQRKAPSEGEDLEAGWRSGRILVIASPNSHHEIGSKSKTGNYSQAEGRAEMFDELRGSQRLRPKWRSSQSQSNMHGMFNAGPFENNRVRTTPPRITPDVVLNTFRVLSEAICEFEANHFLLRVAEFASSRLQSWLPNTRTFLRNRGYQIHTRRIASFVRLRGVLSPGSRRSTIDQLY
jgi:hypothetical protein